MAELVSTTYSTALFDVSVEENKVDIFMDEMAFIRDTLKMHNDFFELLKSPGIGLDEKKNMLNSVFGDKVSKEVANFLKILIDKRRIKHIVEIAQSFEDMVYDHKGIVKAKAYTSVPLTEDKLKKLEAKLSEKTGKTVEIENLVDETLLGGVMIKFNDLVIDGTLKGKLKDLENNLNRIIV